MNFEKIIKFLTTDFFGLLILGIISSIFASVIYDFLKKRFRSTHQKIKKKRFANHLIKIAESFGQGSRAGHADLGTTFQQTVLVGDYVIKTIVLVGWILFYLLLSIAMLIILGTPFSWIPVIIFSILITIRYKKLKLHLDFFEQTFKLAYGEKYFENELKGQKEYWEKILNEKKQSRGEK